MLINFQKASTIYFNVSLNLSFPSYSTEIPKEAQSYTEKISLLGKSMALLCKERSDMGLLQCVMFLGFTLFELLINQIFSNFGGR